MNLVAPASSGAYASIASAVAPVATDFVAAGFQLFLVGGVVRDLLLDRHGAGDDIDATTVDDDTIGDVTDDATDCFLSGRGGNAGLWVLQAVPNAVNWGIAPAAATIRAKYDAARFVKHGEADRKPNVFIGTGAALLGAGAIGRIVVMVIRIQSLEPEKGIALNCLDGAETEVSDFFSCYANKNAQLYAAHQITSAGVAGGAGLLAYGIVYKRERRNLEKKYDLEKQAQLEFRVEPQLSFNHTGVAATLRF